MAADLAGQRTSGRARAVLWSVGDGSEWRRWSVLCWKRQDRSLRDQQRGGGEKARGLALTRHQAMGRWRRRMIAARPATCVRRPGLHLDRPARFFAPAA